MTSPLTPPHDVVAGATARLDAAQDASDQERLRVLDELYAGLEAELEKDFEQARPPGR
ncbi:MAG TPA: hypothetical protein VG318_03725 [Actinomycetota bacterium]|nr:hypothetical protein [Actinomycetota bacterium]